MKRIEEIAARYGTLHRQGANYVMLCPFHQDHHPSLSIHVAGQYFKCFACGKGGDAIALVRGFEGCTFKEAVSLVEGEERSVRSVRSVRSTRSLRNPESPSTPSPPSPQSLAENEGFLGLLLPYATGHTALSPTYLDFEVGLAPHILPPRWQKFAGRLIFPIRDDQGRLVGFAGRQSQQQLTIDNGELTIDSPESSETVHCQLSTVNCQLSTDHCQLSTVNCQLRQSRSAALPKYLNSSAREGFDKSRMLYGIHRAKEAIRRSGEAYIVEGYKDALAMHAAGLTQTVAIGGTTLTEAQQQLLAHYGAHRLILALDGDPAGRQAMRRIAQKGKGEAAIIIAILPDGDDPDSLFRRLGTDDFRQYIRWAASTAPVCEQRLVNYALLHPTLAPALIRRMQIEGITLTDPHP